MAQIINNTTTIVRIIGKTEAANDPVFDGAALRALKRHGKKVVYVGERDEIMTQSYYNRLWMAVSGLEIPRRQWVDKISIDVAKFDGVILHRDEKLFQFPDLDEVFGEDVWDMRWMSGFLKADASGMAPKAVSRAWRKVQLIDLSLRIAHPNLARHFGK